MGTRIRSWKVLLLFAAFLGTISRPTVAEEGLDNLLRYENFIRYYPNDQRAARTFDAIVKLASESTSGTIDAEYADLADIYGASFDEETGRLLLWGPRIKTGQAGRLPPLLLADDFVTALKVVDAGEDPGVSIGTYGFRRPTQEEMDRDFRNGILPVEYMPHHIGGSHAATILFEADRWLKTLGIGVDNLDKKRHRSRVNGHHFMSDYAKLESNIQAGSVKPFGRNWFLPDAPRVVCEGYSMKFAGYKMRVKYEAYYPDPSIEAFATDMTDNFDQYKKRYPVFQELVRLHKLVQVARWYKASGFPYKEMVAAYEPMQFERQKTTRLVKAQVRNSNSYLVGGVDFSAPNYYLPSSEVPRAHLKPASKPTWNTATAPSSRWSPPMYGTYMPGQVPVPSFAAPMLQSRPAPQSLTWTVHVGGETMRVVAIQLKGV